MISSKSETHHRFLGLLAHLSGGLIALGVMALSTAKFVGPAIGLGQNGRGLTSNVGWSLLIVAALLLGAVFLNSRRLPQLERSTRERRLASGGEQG